MTARWCRRGVRLLHGVGITHDRLMVSATAPHLAARGASSTHDGSRRPCDTRELPGASSVRNRSSVCAWLAGVLEAYPVQRSIPSKPHETLRLLSHLDPGGFLYACIHDLPVSESAEVSNSQLVHSIVPIIVKHLAPQFIFLRTLLQPCDTPFRQ